MRSAVKILAGFCLLGALAGFGTGCAGDKSPVLPVLSKVVAVDKEPVALTLGWDGETLLAVCHEAGTIAVIDPVQAKVVQTLPVLPKPGSLLTDAPHALVYCLYPQTSAISLLSGKPLKNEKNLSTGNITLASATARPGHDEIWICDGVSAVHVLTAGHLQLKNSFPVGRYPQRLVFSIDGGTAWVTLKGENALVALNPDTGQEIARVPVGIYPRDAVMSGATVCVSNYGSHDVSLVDTASRAERARVPVRRQPNALTLQGQTLWVSCEDSYRLVAIQVAQAQVIGTIKTGFYPGALRALPNGALAVCDPRHDRVVIFTPQTPAP